MVKACRDQRSLQSPCTLPRIAASSHSSEQGYREDAGLYLESDTDEQLLLHIPFGTAVRLSGIVIQTKEKREQVHREWGIGSAMWGVEQRKQLWLSFTHVADAATDIFPLSFTPQAPSHIKLFVNRPSLGFSEAADEPAQADFVLTNAQLAGETIPLMYADWLGDEIIPSLESFIHLHSASTFSQPLHNPSLIRRVARFSRVSHLTIFVDDNAEDTDTTVIEKIQLLGSGGDSFNVAEIKDISKDQS